MGVGFSLEVLRNRLGFSGKTGFWKFIALLFALINLKTLPLAWHVSVAVNHSLSDILTRSQIRLITGLLRQIRSSRLRLASKSGPSTLFQPVITSSRSPFLECDYNLHKSNSTYFSDFDVGRLELLVSLCGYGIDQTRKELAKESKDGFATMLGGVSCNFKREIKPFQAFEVWTRILCWNNKWIYVIGYFVKKGAVKPSSYTLQPWKKSRANKAEGTGGAVNNDGAKPGPHPAIFASAIAKYVFKKGRLTIPPERVLRASQLLPPKPADHETPPMTMTPSPETNSIDATAASVVAVLTPDNAGDLMAASLTAGFGESDEWTWERVENERKRGMRIAELYQGLEALSEEFTGENMPVLGQY